MWSAETGGSSPRLTLRSISVVEGYHCNRESNKLPEKIRLYVTSGDNLRPRRWDWVVSARQSGNRAVLSPYRASEMPASGGKPEAGCYLTS